MIDSRRRRSGELRSMGQVAASEKHEAAMVYDVLRGLDRSLVEDQVAVVSIEGEDSGLR